MLADYSGNGIIIYSNPSINDYQKQSIIQTLEDIKTINESRNESDKIAVYYQAGEEFVLEDQIVDDSAVNFFKNMATSDVESLPIEMPLSSETIR